MTMHVSMGDIEKIDMKLKTWPCVCRGLLHILTMAVACQLSPWNGGPAVARHLRICQACVHAYEAAQLHLAAPFCILSLCCTLAHCA